MDEKTTLHVTLIDKTTAEIRVPSFCEDVNAYVLQLSRAGGLWLTDTFIPMSAVLRIEARR